MTEEVTEGTGNVYLHWSQKGNRVSVLACSADKQKVREHIGKMHKLEADHMWIAPVEMGLFQYPIWLLEKFDPLTMENSFEVIRDKEDLLARLRGILEKESPYSTDSFSSDYPYTLYPVGEEFFLDEGMGSLTHHHIDSELLEDLESRWWDLPYEFVSNNLMTFRTDMYEGFELEWAAKRIGWGGITFSRKVPKEGETPEPYKVDTECMSREFVDACVKDFLDRCHFGE